MAQRSSRSNKKKRRTKGEVRKQPELRTGGGRAAKAARTRERVASATTASAHGPAVRIRPAGWRGFAEVLLLAYLGVAGVAVLGKVLHRWDILSYPDTLWLYTAFGMLAVAAAVGRVARSDSDTDSWGAQALLVPLGMLVAERLLGPACPPNGDCAVVGARGSLGIGWSIVACVALAAAAWGIARWSFSRARDRRPTSGRVRYGIAARAIIATMLLVGIPITAVMSGLDIMLRDEPKLVADAATDVEKFCFSFDANPTLAVRPSPDGVDPTWSTFAVRNSKEHRPGVGRSKLPADWAKLDYVHPYEAEISYTSDGLADVSCRKVDSDSGTATKADLAPNAFDASTNPLDPLTTGANFFPLFYRQDTSAIAAKADASKPAVKAAVAHARAAEAKSKAATKAG
ncbi:MAG: hypothetical protein JWN41_1381 [Thermoleophilia bacterium]|nr:hypothetical protein [Thermoleophilia bacterium]